MVERPIQASGTLGNRPGHIEVRSEPKGMGPEPAEQGVLAPAKLRSQVTGRSPNALLLLP
jgi:hypothetical protein